MRLPNLPYYSSFLSSDCVLNCHVFCFLILQVACKVAMIWFTQSVTKKLLKSYENIRNFLHLWITVHGYSLSIGANNYLIIFFIESNILFNLTYLLVCSQKVVTVSEYFCVWKWVSFIFERNLLDMKFYFFLIFY